jgi:hypothetical protein
MSRYAIAHSSLPGWSRFLVGDFETRSFVDVTPGEVVFSLGRLGLTVPRRSVVAAVRIDYPARIRIGWRKNRRRTLTLVAARPPVVRLQLEPPPTMRFFGFNAGVDEVIVSVEDAASFLAEFGQPDRRA